VGQVMVLSCVLQCMKTQCHAPVCARAIITMRAASCGITAQHGGAVPHPLIITRACRTAVSGAFMWKKGMWMARTTHDHSHARARWSHLGLVCGRHASTDAACQWLVLLGC
jgi:hypothetical protein